MLTPLTCIKTSCRFTKNKLIMEDLDYTKVNPILGYEMYTQRDRALMASRSAYGIAMPVRRTPKIDRDV